MKFGSITTGIIANGLIFNMDAANRASYVPNATTSYNTIDLSQSGSFINDPTYISPPTSASCWNFDGIDDYVDCGTFAALDSATALTLSVWFKSSVYTTSGRLVNLEKHVEIYQSNASYGNTQGRFYYKLMGDYGNGFKTLGGTSASGVGNLCDGNWHHLCFVWDNSTTTSVVYEDGVAVITDTSTTGTLNSASDTFYIGADPSGANPITGNIANVHIYNRALSSNEVLHNYNALKNRFI
jgi:hypothetical protein